MSDKNPCEDCTQITSNSYSEHPKSSRVHYICPGCYKERNARQRAELHDWLFSTEGSVFFDQLKANQQKSQARVVGKTLDKWLWRDLLIVFALKPPFKKRKGRMFSRAFSPIPPLHVVLSTLSSEQYNNLLHNQDLHLRRTVDANILVGWTYVVMPQGVLLNTFERFGKNMHLHLDDDNGNSFTTTFPATPGIFIV